MKTQYTHIKYEDLPSMAARCNALREARDLAMEDHEDNDNWCPFADKEDPRREAYFNERKRLRGGQL